MSNENTLRGNYVGGKSDIFWLVFKTSLLTIITAGIYRFWARTRLRRYVWSSTTPGGDAFEYTGTGLEKFLGFLVALVVLAVYLGIVQVLLTVVGYNIFEIFSTPANSEAQMIAQITAPYIVLLALTPILFFANYRARRYMLSRTRWRGVRFGMDKAALKYVLRGLFWGLLVVVTFGLTYPLAMYKLEKFKTDRMWYGDAKFELGGSAGMLYGPFKHFLFGLLGLIAVVVLAGAAEAPGIAVVGMLGFTST